MTEDRSVSRRRFARGVLLAAPVVAAVEFLPGADADAATAPSWVLGGNALSGTGRIGTTSKNDFVVETAGKERLRILASGGAIGIGTPAPAGQLHVVQSSKPISALLVDQQNPDASDAITVTSATTGSGNGVSAGLTAEDPGLNAAGVFGYVANSATSDAVGVWGQHDGAGRGVYGEVEGAGVGVSGNTGSYDGLGGFFTNPNLGPSSDPGTAIRALAAGATYADLHPAAADYDNAGGEFGGAVGVIGSAKSGQSGGIGVIGLGSGAAGFGVLGRALGTDAAGVEGYHPTTGSGVRGIAVGAGLGVYGNCNQSAGAGGAFINRASGTPGAGVRGQNGQGTNTTVRDAAAVLGLTGYAAGEFAGGIGVLGCATVGSDLTAGVAGVGPDDGSFGVLGQAQEFDFAGVGGYAKAGNGAYGVFGAGDVGVFAVGRDPDNTALSVLGNADVTGTLSKGGGSFKIDHPLDPADKYLYHSFVESPDMMNVYNGVVVLDARGQAAVQMPDWFEALNRDFRYQLTPLGTAAPDLHVRAEMHDGQFGIAGGVPGQRVSWQVTGIRQDAWADANRIPVEVEKPQSERGHYLHPEVIDREARPLAFIATARAMAARHTNH